MQAATRAGPPQRKRGAKTQTQDAVLRTIPSVKARTASAPHAPRNQGRPRPKPSPDKSDRPIYHYAKRNNKPTSRRGGISVARMCHVSLRHHTTFQRISAPSLITTHGPSPSTGRLLADFAAWTPPVSTAAASYPSSVSDNPLTGPKETPCAEAVTVCQGKVTTLPAVRTWRALRRFLSSPLLMEPASFRSTFANGSHINETPLDSAPNQTKP